METKTALRELESILGRTIMADSDRDQADACLEALWDEVLLGR